MRKTHVQKVRKVYVGGKREEASLAGALGFMGSSYELLVGNDVPLRDRPDHIRARKSYYRLHPDHPANPLWRPDDFEPFASLSWEAKKVYLDAIVKATEEWTEQNPQARPVHPDSADWNPEWDSLKDDPHKLGPPRYAFLNEHQTEFMAVPGLFEALSKHKLNFIAYFYDELYGD